MPGELMLNIEVLVELKRRRSYGVLLVLLGFKLYPHIDGVFREYRLKELTVSFKFFKRLFERAGAFLYSHLASSLGREVVDVLVARVSRVHLFLYAVKPCCCERSERVVDVATGIRRSELYPLGSFLALLVNRNSYARRPVALAPRDVNRRLIARHKPLVGIRGWRGDGAERP